MPAMPTWPVPENPSGTAPSVGSERTLAGVKRDSTNRDVHVLVVVSARSFIRSRDPSASMVLSAKTSGADMRMRDVSWRRATRLMRSLAPELAPDLFRNAPIKHRTDRPRALSCPCGCFRSALDPDEISPGGAVNTFVTATAGLNEPVLLAFSPVPVPSSLVLAAAGIVALAVWARAHRGTA
jgi:hypothetical protein